MQFNARFPPNAVRSLIQLLERGDIVVHYVVVDGEPVIIAAKRVSPDDTCYREGEPVDCREIVKELREHLRKLEGLSV